MWLWHRLAAAAPIQPLAWELPYATGAKQTKRDEFPRVSKSSFPVYPKDAKSLRLPTGINLFLVNLLYPDGLIQEVTHSMEAQPLGRWTSTLTFLWPQEALRFPCSFKCGNLLNLNPWINI